MTQERRKQKGWFEIVNKNSQYVFHIICGIYFVIKKYKKIPIGKIMIKRLNWKTIKHIYIDVLKYNFNIKIEDEQWILQRANSSIKWVMYKSEWHIK